MPDSITNTVTSTTFTAHGPSELAERRCWRCLQMFPAGPSAHGRDEFWLCDPCDATLLPSKRRPS
jgi:hypothetical protein